MAYIAKSGEIMYSIPEDVTKEVFDLPELVFEEDENEDLLLLENEEEEGEEEEVLEDITL